MRFTKMMHSVAGFVIFIILNACNGCNSKFPEIRWNFSTKTITGAPPVKTDHIDLDIYLDATTSMEGFAVNPASVYSQFLDQLEASALSAWQKTDPQFYKFGQTIRPINRNEFLSAKNDPSFYHERGIFMKTYIDSVVKHTDTARLSVLITDLFQNEGDVNIMVESFKSKCFIRGVTIGFIGIKSAFNGKVFDVSGYPSGYPLNVNERPFYAVVFGNEYNMQLLFNSLKAKPFVKENQFFIISNHIIKSYQVALSKTRDSKFINNKNSHPDVNSFDFGMKKEGKDGQFDLVVTLDRNTRCADFSPGNIEVVAFKKSISDPKATSKDSVTSSEVSLQKIQRNGNKASALLVLQNDDPPGNYSYEIYLKANQLNGLEIPGWVKDFSTDNPVPATEAGAKTYNLGKLCSTLLVANSSVAPTYLAKFYINIYKR